MKTQMRRGDSQCLVLYIGGSKGKKDRHSNYAQHTHVPDCRRLADRKLYLINLSNRAAVACRDRYFRLGAPPDEPSNRTTKEVLNDTQGSDVSDLVRHAGAGN